MCGWIYFTIHSNMGLANTYLLIQIIPRLGIPHAGYVMDDKYGNDDQYVMDDKYVEGDLYVIDDQDQYVLDDYYDGDHNDFMNDQDTKDDCGCQCSSLSFVDSENIVQGNCRR